MAIHICSICYILYVISRHRQTSVLMINNSAITLSKTTSKAGAGYAHLSISIVMIINITSFCIYFLLPHPPPRASQLLPSLKYRLLSFTRGQHRMCLSCQFFRDCFHFLRNRILLKITCSILPNICKVWKHQIII